MTRRERPAAVAGLFYPALAEDLRSTVAWCVGEAAAPGPAPKALIVPHAGYIYSGPIAGTGYGRLAPLRDVIRRVVLIGPAHRVAFEGIATTSVQAMRTPLGPVPVDLRANAELTDVAHVIQYDESHAPEHSLEVHLPFLQVLLDDFAVVPLLVGNAPTDAVAEVLARLWGGPETLLIVSSDLSHYHDYKTARALDLETAEAIEALDPGGLHGRRACGHMGIKGLLTLARRRGMRIERLDLRTSGDTAGPKDQVVGYGAWALFEIPRIA